MYQMYLQFLESVCHEQTFLEEDYQMGSQDEAFSQVARWICPYQVCSLVSV